MELILPFSYPAYNATSFITEAFDEFSSVFALLPSEIYLYFLHQAGPDHLQGT